MQGGAAEFSRRVVEHLGVEGIAEFAMVGSLFVDAYRRIGSGSGPNVRTWKCVVEDLNEIGVGR